MKAKTLILLFVALGCGMIAAVAVSKAVMDNGSAQPEEQMVEIFVAVKDLQQTERISPENVKLDKWPKDRLPDGAIFDLEKIDQKFTKQNIFAGEPILERKLSDSVESFSTTVPTGHRIFDIVCASSYIKAGDHVDILGTFRPGGRQAPPESRTVMRNVKVHGINGNSSRDEEEEQPSNPGLPKATVFQLLVKESQLEALTLANTMGELQLNLRPFGEDHNLQDDGEDFLDWIRDNDPDAEEEPAGMFTSLLPTQQAPPPEEVKKNSMIIIHGSTGYKQYEWSEDNAMPKEVGGEEESSQFTSSQTNPYGPSGNVYSGYGGYSPTYPVSTTPPAPAQDGAQATAAALPQGSNPVNGASPVTGPPANPVEGE